MPNRSDNEKITDLVHQFAGLSKCVPQFVEVMFNKELSCDADDTFKSVYGVLLQNMQMVQFQLTCALNTPATEEEKAVQGDVFRVLADANTVKHLLTKEGRLLIQKNGGYFEVNVKGVQPPEEVLKS